MIKIGFNYRVRFVLIFVMKIVEIEKRPARSALETKTGIGR
jgi:hypothetical protein